jgi:type II secretory pathway pseudopilin PulG
MKLIELLMAIVIIAVLVSLAAPVAVRKFKESKRELLKLERGRNATIELFARDEAEEARDPRLRAIRAQQELNWLGGR